MTLFTTILAGVSVFVLGRILLKWIIEPIRKLREVIAEVVFYLANDHSIIHNANVVDKEEALSAGKNLKRLGAKLVSSQQLISCAGYFGDARKFSNSPESSTQQGFPADC
ncbi:MAG: hypothetical protein U9O82_03250 [Thermodesulfobacteriota bacterium]|nr:hypothetical protein [Thermodesulfobacteriota bacterium]